MKKSKAEKSPFSKFHHVTVVVKDIEQAAKYYSSIGIGPFKPYPYESTFSKMKIKIAPIGPIEFQLVQPGEGKTIYTEFLRKRGEGVQHLGFLVDDIDEEEAKLKKSGLKVHYSRRREDGSGFTYFDTDAIGGVTLSIRQNAPNKQK